MRLSGSRRPTIVLLDPPYYRLYKDSYSLPRYPLSLGYLAGHVRRHTDWRVVAYNADFTPNSEQYKVAHLCGPGFESYGEHLRDINRPIWGQIAGVISSYGPDVVGISCKSQTFASACMVARLVKRISPTIKVVMGGAHAAMVGKAILDCPEVDVVVRGEGEQTLVQLLEAMQTGRPLEQVDGIVFRADGQLVETPPRGLLTDLDSLEHPHESAPHVLHDYKLYPLDAFSHIFATRGCPYNCFFCGSRNVWGRKVRFRSAENVVQEIHQLQQLGLSSVHFDDDTFGVKPNYIRELCDGLGERCPSMRFSCELHVNLVNDQTIEMMTAAGSTSIQLGVESGNNAILSQIRKGFTIDKAIAAADTIRRHGATVQAFFMVGFPQETEETLADTVAAMRRIKGQLSYSIFTPYPGTEAFEYCKQRGLVSDDFDTSLHNHQSPANCFCEHIKPQRLRQLISPIERMVDRKNWPSPLRRVLTGQLTPAQATRKALAKLAQKFATSPAA